VRDVFAKFQTVGRSPYALFRLRPIAVQAMECLPATFKLALPKGLTVLYEEYCGPSEKRSFDYGVRNLAGGDLKNSRPTK
jgi:hypothetical protein